MVGAGSLGKTPKQAVHDPKLGRNRLRQRRGRLSGAAFLFARVAAGAVPYSAAWRRAPENPDMVAAISSRTQRLNAATLRLSWLDSAVTR